MTQFWIDLPFFIPLAEDDYSLKIGDEEIQISHTVIQANEFDSRIGDIAAGSFGFVRDRVGILRHSRLAIDLGDEAISLLGTILTGRHRSFSGPADFQGKGQVALAIFNRFLDKYRIVTRSLDVRPVGQWDLALLRFDDGRNAGTLSLYAGGITLPPLPGLAPEYHQKLLDSLARPEPNPTFQLAAIDALRTVEDGQTLESIVTCIGALEAALDQYFSRTWRLATPRVGPTEAAARMGITNRRDRREIRTVEDVLEKAGVRRKLKVYADAARISPDKRDDLFEAIFLRNLAVHGGVRVPIRKAKPRVHKVADFVLEELSPRIQSECPNLPRRSALRL